jgi:dihydroflavonol-4-reductase
MAKKKLNQKILVTGGSGFLGYHLCAHLKQLGNAEIISFGRTLSPKLSALGIQQIQGSVTDFQAFKEAAQGVQEIYHLAGMVSRAREYSGPMYALHIEGNRNLLRVVEELKIDQVVALSTSGVSGVSKKAVLADESTGFAWELIRQWPYYESKAMAEQELQRGIQRGLKIKIARPALLLGPGDDRGSSHGDVLKFLSGDVKSALPGGLCAVDARDVAAFLPILMAKGEVGVGYMLGAQNLSIRAFLNHLAQISGVDAPLLDLSASVVNKAPRLLKWASKQAVFGAIDEQTFEMGCCYWYIDSTKAIELGFQARSFSKTLNDTIDDLIAQGLFWRKS